MKQSACYYPIIPNKQGEIDAVGHLSPHARSRTRIIFEIDRPSDQSPENLEKHISDSVRRISNAWGNRYPLLVDLPAYGPEHLISNGEHAIKYACDCLRQKNIEFVPIAGPILERELFSLEIIGTIARYDQRGVALRFPYHELSNTDLFQRELLDALGVLALNPDEVDILFDLEAVFHISDKQRNVKYLTSIIYEAISVLSKYGNFRNIVLSGSSIPENVGKRYEKEPYKGDRLELLVWREILQNSAIPISFSDNGITSPRSPDSRGFGIPPARVRLSTPKEHIFYRANSAKYKDLCKLVVTSDDFNNEIPSWGASSLLECANGRYPSSAPVWIARDNNIHLENTVVVVEKYLKEVGKIKHYHFPNEETFPWLQESMFVPENL